MAASDAILIGEDWISEHYFSTDATSQSFQARVLARRKEWDAAETPTVRSRFTTARGDLETALADLVGGNGSTADPSSAAAAAPRFDADAARRVYARLRNILGYATGGYHLDAAGPVLRVSAPGITADAPLVLVEARPVEAVDDLLERDAPTLLEPVALDEKTTLTSAPRLLSALFVADDAPSFALVMAGRWLLVAEKDRWAEGRYLAVDLQLVCERNKAARGGEIDRALACVCADSLAPDAEGDIWWTATLEESIKHTVGVSKDLREGVRLSIEIIANEVVTRRRHRGLDPLPADQAQPLAKQSLRFLYRILFLLYAEASPELGVLPVGASEYEQGYSLDRLRDLTLVELTSPHARTGTHLYESLALLFRVVDTGHQQTHPGQALRERIDTSAEGTGDGALAGVPDGLTFQALRADLFLPAATALIDEVGLGNEALQRVLRHLLLSKESGKDRGFISYAELGINQLGAVYEGLMSYTGFFAETDLYEVAKNGDSSKGSWVVPVERAGGIAEADFVRTTDPATGENKAVLHERGTFVFRLAGRERQQSASYYTPEVLTRFTVSQALEELLDSGGTTTPAADILTMTVCEPALGSGAFAIEAVRQLATEYLSRRQRETGEKIDPDAYPRELQKVKAYLALHNVYGVDLNATAVELAEISLWLDTMVEGLHAPWFGLHLRRGNSLIGARHATYSRAQVNDRSWLTATPTDHPLTDLTEALTNGSPSIAASGRIHHFLLPAYGWGSAVEAKEATALGPDSTKVLKAWRSSIRVKPTAKQVADLVDLAHRVEALWQLARRRLQIAETQVRRNIPIWGHQPEPAGGVVTRKQIEASLADPNGAYRRLRRVMDAWTALWFWPLTETGVKPPTLEQWIEACRALLGRNMESSRRSPKGMAQLGSHLDWNALGDAETFDLSFAGAKKTETVLDEHPWLRVCEQVAERQGFFHWELDFATVFARGGFDLQVGNPPWVRPDWDEAAILAEFDVTFALESKIEVGRAAALKAGVLGGESAAETYLNELGANSANRSLVSSPTRFPHLEGLRPDLYRCFMEQTWRQVADGGSIGLVHPDTHFTDEKAGRLRAETYSRLRRLWVFSNRLILFEGVGALKTFAVNVSGLPNDSVNFQMATALFHPDTVDRSLRHDGSGAEPGIKDAGGRWDERPHASRIIVVTDAVLETWSQLTDIGSAPFLQTRLVHLVGRSAAGVLAAIGRQPRLRDLGFRFSLGWDEGADFKRGLFVKRWGLPDDWDDAILQGPHLHVATPLYKSPNPTMSSKSDWSANDVERIQSDELPVTAYKPSGDRYDYDCAYDDWGTESEPIPARDFYRVAWRGMTDNVGSRSLLPAIIPPGAAHVDGIFSMGAPDRPLSELVQIAGEFASILVDFAVRVVPKSTIRSGAAERLPAVLGHELSSRLVLRTLRLNCVTNAYSRLWAECWDERFVSDKWAGGLEYPGRRPLCPQGPEWTRDSPLRNAADRHQALVEVDALVALILGVSADELCSIYRVQFPILLGYDSRRDHYDANGRLVPNDVLTAYRKKGERITLGERMATNQAGNTYTYELPFQTMDREADMREAYAHFERILAERTNEGME